MDEWKQLIEEAKNGLGVLVLLPVDSMKPTVRSRIRETIIEMKREWRLNGVRYSWYSQRLNFEPSGGYILILPVDSWMDKDKVMSLDPYKTYLVNPSVIDRVKQISIVDHIYL